MPESLSQRLDLAETRAQLAAEQAPPQPAEPNSDQARRNKPPSPPGPVLPFQPGALRHLAHGRKRGTVIRPAKAVQLELGAGVQAASRALPGVRVRLRVVALLELDHLGKLPATAERHGYQLADFSSAPDWRTYQQQASRQHRGRVWLLGVEPVGPVPNALAEQPAEQPAEQAS